MAEKSVYDLHETDLHRRRRGRNLAVGGVLLAMALIIFTVTIVKLGANSLSPFAEYNHPGLNQ